MLNVMKDVDLLELYFESYNETLTMFKELKDRKVINEDMSNEEVISVYQKLKKEELINDLISEGLSNEEAVRKVEKELNRKCRVCGCTFFNGCSGGCYWIEEDLCSSCMAFKDNLMDTTRKGD